MNDSTTRRQFAAVVGAGLLVPGATVADEPKPKPAGPVEAPFERDYPAPKFQPSWKKQQINRQMVQDFVMYGHGDLPMVKKLLEKEPALLNATVDWGGGDWESALGGASHIGDKETRCASPTRTGRTSSRAERWGNGMR